MSGMRPTVQRQVDSNPWLLTQFTGVSLQKDDNAFCKFDTALLVDSTLGLPVDNIHSDPES